MAHQGKPGPIQEPWDSIMALDLFERFQTVEEFKARFNAEAPPFIDTWQVKFWADPTAAASKLKNIPYTGVDDDGQLFTFTVPKAIADRVNLPPEILPVEDRYGLGVCPMPVRPLVAPEQIGKVPFGGGPRLENADLMEAETQKDPLVRIEAKLDKLIQMFSAPRSLSESMNLAEAVKPADVTDWANTISALMPLVLAFIAALKARKGVSQ